jgi:hypothetical protein
MTLLRPNFRPESWAQNAGNSISGVQISKKFRGGMPPDPPSIASISAMIPSDLRLDPPLVRVRVGVWNRVSVSVSKGPFIIYTWRWYRREVKNRL